MEKDKRHPCQPMSTGGKRGRLSRVGPSVGPCGAGLPFTADSGAQIDSIRGKTHHECWWSESHVDLFFVFHPLFSFPSHFHAGFSVFLFSARLPGAQQVRLHGYLGLESARRLDPYRLDYRLGLGALFGAAAAGCGPGTTGCPSPTRCWNRLFLQRLRKVLRGWSPLLQFLRRRAAGYVPVMWSDLRREAGHEEVEEGVGIRIEAHLCIWRMRCVGRPGVRARKSLLVHTKVHGPNRTET